MVVNEIFYSLQGEGFLAGLPSVFIRLAGCPLRCRWCDTKYAWDEAAGEKKSIEQIVKAVKAYQNSFVVITGGEPMVNPDLVELTQRIKDSGMHITIETAGIEFLDGLACDLMSVSPKLSNSTPLIPELAELHESRRFNKEVLGKLIGNYDYQIKFVVASRDDLFEIQAVVDGLPAINCRKVMLMPQAASRDELLAKSKIAAEMCKAAGFAFCQRLQVLLWDGKREK